MCVRPGSEPYPDVRTADIARAAEIEGHPLAEVVDGYEREADEPLSPEERAALQLLPIAVQFERLAGLLVDWAAAGPADRPVDAFDRACADIESELDRLDVPRESGPPPRGARGRG